MWLIVMIVLAATSGGLKSLSEDVERCLSMVSPLCTLQLFMDYL